MMRNPRSPLVPGQPLLSITIDEHENAYAVTVRERTKAEPVIASWFCPTWWDALQVLASHLHQNVQVPGPDEPLTFVSPSESTIPAFSESDL